MHVAMDGPVTTVATELTMLGDSTGAIVKINEYGSNSPAMGGISFPGPVAFHGEGNACIAATVSLPAGTPAGGMVWKSEAEAFQMKTTMSVASPEATQAG